MTANTSPEKKLTPLETLIMNVLWDESPVAVKQVQQRLESSRPMAYNTVLMMMRIPREKGDDLVVYTTDRDEQYARCLLGVAEQVKRVAP